MSTVKLSNISIAEFKEFLKDKGCTETVSGNDGHEKWTKEGSLRPIVFQSHIDPVPEFIILNNLRNIGMTRKDFSEWYLNRKRKQKPDSNSEIKTK